MEWFPTAARVALYYPFYYLFYGLLQLLFVVFQIVLVPVRTIGRIPLYLILLPWKLVVEFQVRCHPNGF
ncbi:hypothetical protein BDV59DRAFT_167117 [Aspergillus ambiguus]|uniref:uncharacterized protein n=1 Tax=Aspergillus ambiguus TaxID=176160 RepID=UPI003CCC9E92